MNGGRQVIEKELPGKFVRGTAHFFFEEIQPLFEANRGSFVFDLSRVLEIDSAGVGVLLRCLEEAMKGNGDIKLASLSPEAAAILELTGVGSLFEIFQSKSLAVESFRVLNGQSIRTVEKLGYPYLAHAPADVQMPEFQSSRLSRPMEGS